MINRIIEIRKDKNLTQEQFAQALGLSRTFINQVESGKKNISDRTISDICEKFGINEDWLKNGKEPKFVSKNTKLNSYLGSIAGGNDEFIQDLIEVYMELDQTSKDALKEIALKMAEKQKKKGR